jgi:hypothetical protein
MNWTWNKDYKDLGQVAEFYPAYLVVYEELRAAGQYPFNASFKGRIPGIEGDREDTAIYLLQNLRRLHEVEAMLTEHRAAGWRDVRPAELDGSPVRYAGVIEYAIYDSGAHCAGSTAGGTGWREWQNARLTRYHSSVMVLPARKRTNGHLVAGRLIVRD